MNGLLSGPTATIPVDAKVAAVRAPMNVGITAPPNTLFTRRRQRRGIRCRPRLWHQAKVVRNREVRYALHAAARWRRVSRSARFDDPIELHGRQHPNQNPATCAIGLKENASRPRGGNGPECSGFWNCVGPLPTCLPPKTTVSVPPALGPFSFIPTCDGVRRSVFLCAAQLKF
jgi:hypothetical protein